MTKVEFMLSDFRALGLAQEELESAIPGIGMEVEELSGKSIKIDVTPNRPELLNFDMMANALLMFTGKRKPDAEKYKAEDAQSPKVVVDESVTGIRPYISCMIARGLDLSGNRLRYLIDFSEKLSEGYGRHRSKLAMGIHNLDAINGNIEYLAGDGKFIPLGSSEARSFTDILRDSQKGVAYSHTVSKGNGKVPYLRDSEKILSMIPIINSEASKISHSTKNLFIDMTGTSSTAVSDAADIMACALIAGGATVQRILLDYSKDGKTETTPRLEAKSTRVGVHKAEKSLGFYLDSGKIAGLAERMGHIGYVYGRSLVIKSAPYRKDILGEQDIVEDIAMAYGFDRIEPLPVVSQSFGAIGKHTESYELASEIMVGMGYSEAMNNYLTSESTCFTKMCRKRDEKSSISVEYSKTENMSVLRDIVLPSLMEDLERSANEPMPQSLFEFGSVFSMHNGRAIEGTRLALVKEHSKANLSEAASCIKEFCLRFYGKAPDFKDSENEYFIKGRCADVVVDGKRIGAIGEVSPAVLRNFNLSDPVIAAELSIEDEKAY